MFESNEACLISGSVKGWWFADFFIVECEYSPSIHVVGSVHSIRDVLVHYEWHLRTIVRLVEA